MVVRIVDIDVSQVLDVELAILQEKLMSLVQSFEGGAVIKTLKTISVFLFSATSC